MIFGQTFRRHYLISALVIVFFIVLGFLGNSVIINLSLNNHKWEGPSAVMFAKLIDELGGSNRAFGVKRLHDLSGNKVPVTVSVLDQSGKLIAAPELAEEPTQAAENDDHFPSPSHEISPEQWNSLTLPTQVYQSLKVPNGEHPQGQHPHGPPPGIFGLGPIPGLGGGGGPHGPPPPHFECELIRLKGEPANYAYACPVDHRDHPKPPMKLFFLSVLVLVLSVVLGAGASLLLLFRSFGKKARSLDHVISELQNGNLKARVPITRMDEVGQAMARFNKMAEEIERLVEHLKSVEKSRMFLLQELAHDLRTPVASLKSLIETLTLRGAALTPEMRDDFTLMTFKEIDYFERLVEDLLTLAQVSEPKYQAGQEVILLDELVNDEAESVASKAKASASKENKPVVQLEKHFLLSNTSISGDPILLRRIFRNALENAFSFARQVVTLEIKSEAAENAKNEEWLLISIQDDGSGFSEHAIQNYGVRRTTRVAGKQGGRISVGLGSVILKTATEIHGGKVEVKNAVDSSGAILGGRVEIRLPLRSVNGYSFHSESFAESIQETIKEKLKKSVKKLR